MTYCIPLAPGSYRTDDIRFVFAPGLGHIRNGNFRESLTLPCLDCLMERYGPTFPETELLKAISNPQAPASVPAPVEICVCSTVTELRTVKVHEIFYEGKCSKCKVVLRIVSVVNLHSCGESVSPFVE
jgi:hypothetical protein